MPIIEFQVQDGLLTVEQLREGERIRLRMRGELDLSNAGTAELKLQEALDTQSPVLVDLSELEFLDSTGIALLVAALGQPTAARLSFVPSETPAVKRLLNLTGLDQRLPLASSAEGDSLLPAA